MNEQIKKLSNQAYDELVNETGNIVVFDEDFQQRFAQLIVKECGVALSPMLRDMVSRGQAYDLIKEHFGVE